MAASLTILLKHSLSKAQQVASVLALMVAALGALYKRANSPKDSPGTYVFKYVGGSPALKTFSQSSSPESTKYKTSPSSPCVITFCPAVYFFLQTNQ